MRRISIGFSDSEYMVLSEIARAHGGNLSNAARSLLHRETIIKSITDTVAAELRSAIAPILESGELLLKNQEIASAAIRNNFGIVLDAITLHSKKTETRP